MKGENTVEGKGNFAGKYKAHKRKRKTERKR